MKRILVIVVLAGTLGACANDEAGVFLTTTKIAVDGDFTEQAVSVGYDRFEGFIGPAFPTGAVPPVVGHIDANTNILQPHVNQFYATGNAAIHVTCPVEGEPCKVAPPPELTGEERRVMYFGTSSVIGLKAGFAGQVPDSITFGYKRKEYLGCQF